MPIPREMFFVVQTLVDVRPLLARLRADAISFLFDFHANDLARIARAVRGRSGLEAIHILADGRPGSIDFGAGILTMENLDRHAAELQTIGRALSAEGLLCFWGADAGRGEGGAAFVRALAKAVGVDVAVMASASAAA